MSNFPNNFDDDTTLPFVNDDSTEMSGEAVNALRDATFAMQQYLGLGADGSTGSIASRLAVSLQPDGYIKPSVITGLGLVTLPITENQIADDASIPESKLRLDHRTQDLYNYIRDLSKDVNTAIGWVATTGIKLQPHLMGAIYRHSMNQIDVSSIVNDYLSNNERNLRDNLNAYTLVRDMNSELLSHQWADGSPFGTPHTITTNNGSLYSSIYGHTASGIFINTSRFTTVPQTAQDLQQFAEYIDSTSIFLLGSRIQNLYSNGISRVSRSISLANDGYGHSVIPSTPAIAYLKNIGNNSSPFDSIDTGDDIIEFKPATADLNNHSFDAKFALVKVGDIIRINYGTVEVPFVIKEKKYSNAGGSKKFLVRIAGKNLAYAPLAIARVERPLVNNNKYGVLAVAPANNNFSETPSLIVASPRGGQALGIGFSPDEFNEKHYLLYLALYPTGLPEDGYTILPAIDVTGNQGTTPGLYSLDSIVEATNRAFRQNGFNYRFIAFTHQGEFGITLADSYGNAAFSVLSAIVTPDGALDQGGTEFAFPNNVVGVFPSVGTVAPDPLGFGPARAHIASPPYMTSYGSAEASQYPTKLYVPLRKNNFYVNGIEKERLNLEVGQALDVNGDGYWVAQIIDVQVPAGRVQTTYRVPLDLSTSNLKPGKTLVVQSVGAGSLVDFGRYTIQNVIFGCNPANYTDITVFDSVHAVGFSPSTTLAMDGYVGLYFNSDSVSFNAETATDFTNYTPFKRHFEVYIDQNSYTFTHERGRFLSSSPDGNPVSINGAMGSDLHTATEIAKIDIVKISPKLRGYQYGNVNKITLNISNYSTNGNFDGYLAAYDGSNLTRKGPTVSSRKGVVTRFYDETNVDFIDLVFDVNTSISSFTNQVLDIQLFPSLALDDELMLIGTCQYNDTGKLVTRVRDERQFGNIGEKDLTTSLLNYIAAPEKLLHLNGVVRGFDIPNVEQEYISIDGGVVLVSGKLLNINHQIITIPRVIESYLGNFYPINWALCINSGGELVAVPLRDHDESLGTVGAVNRVVNLFNVVSLTSYESTSATFVELINKRKDLTLLYIVSSTVTGTGPSATVSLTAADARRFVNDQDSSIPLVVTAGDSQGNFKSFKAATNWLRFNSSFQNTIQVKGSATTDTDPYFGGDPLNGYGNTINVVGQSTGAILTFDLAVELANVRFRDLMLVFTDDTTLNNVEFDNCQVVIQGNLVAGSSAPGIKVRDSSLTVSGESEVTNSDWNNSTTEFEGEITAENVNFEKCDLTFTDGTFSNVVVDTCSLSITEATIIATDSTIVDSRITANTVVGFDARNNFKFERNSVNYVPGEITEFNSDDLVNMDNGFIFSDVTETLVGVKIRDNSFESAESDHAPYISIKISSVDSVMEDSEFSKNRFIATQSSEDLRAVISIISTVTDSVGTTYPKFPRLANVFIDDNMCNSNQMIVLTSVRPEDAPFTNPLLAVTNTRIANNVCGTIGFMTAANIVSTGVNQGYVIADKKDQLLITGNSCKLIANLDHVGDYIPFRSVAFPANTTDTVSVSTGPVTISENAANWIQIGCSSNQPMGNSLPREGVMVVNNRLSPANPAFLSNYTDAVTGVTPGNVGIILRQEASLAGVTRSTISGNNLISNQQINPNSSAIVTYYYDSAIVCFNNANITGNHVYQVIDRAQTPLAPYCAMLYIGDSCEVNVSGNYFERGGANIEAYVRGQSAATTDVRIIDNIFDSQYINSSLVETVGVDIPSSWAFHRNRNQVFYREISLADNSVHGVGQFGGTTLNSTLPAAADLWIHDDPNNSFEIKAFRQYDGVWSEKASTHFITISDFNTDASWRKAWSMRGSVDLHLPENVKIINARVGYFQANFPNANALDHDHTSTGTDFQNNVASLTLFKYKDTATSNGSANGVLDVRNQITAYAGTLGNDLSVDTKVAATHYISSASVETAIRSNTVIITADLNSSNFITGKNYRIAWEIDQNFKKEPGSGNTQVHFHWSPIVLKCVYR